MGFSEDVRKALAARIGGEGPFRNKKQMADALDLDPSQLGRYLKGERGLNVESLGRVLDGLGVRLVFPDQAGESAREVCFVSADKVSAAAAAQEAEPGDFLAVPLVDAAEAALSGAVPESRVRGWVLVRRDHPGMAGRSDLAAVAVADESLSPLLRPGDLAVIDRADRAPEPPGSIMLVQAPGQVPVLRRVSAAPGPDGPELTFSSDHPRDFPPATVRPAPGQRPVIGRVLWSFGDVTGK